MTSLAVGDFIKDNDPRMTGRPAMRVAAIGQTHVDALLGARRVVILRSRIHTDGKPRRSGFSRITTEGKS